MTRSKTVCIKVSLNKKFLSKLIKTFPLQIRNGWDRMATDGDGAIYEDRTLKLGPAIMSKIISDN